MARKSLSDRKKLRSPDKSFTTNDKSMLDSSLVEGDNKRPDWATFMSQFGIQDLPSHDCVELLKCYHKQIDDLLKAILIPDWEKALFALIAGPTGCGKTTLIWKIAERYQDLTHLHLDASVMQYTEFGNPNARIKHLIDEALMKQPSLISIQSIDCIEVDKKSSFVNIIKRMLDVLRKSRVVVIAETSALETVNPILLNQPYFSRIVQMTLPKAAARLEFFDNARKSLNANLTDDEIKKLVDSTECYSYGHMTDAILSSEIQFRTGSVEELNFQVMKLALEQHEPQALKLNRKQIPLIKWDQIGGVEHAKKELYESVIAPIKDPDLFKGYNSKQIRGALLYGPPGCSKTMLAHALAAESGYNFIQIDGPELLSKYVGDSEAALRRVYANARDISPCIVFFDEIDTLFTSRNDEHDSVGRRVIGTLLPILARPDNSCHVFTIAATNRPDHIDRAIIRSGRLGNLIYIPLPSLRDREEIFRINLEDMFVRSDESMETLCTKLAKLTEGYSGADIAAVCDKATNTAIFEKSDRRGVQMRHFMSALQVIKPRTRLDDLLSYERFRDNYDPNQQYMSKVVKKSNKKSSFLHSMKSRWLRRMT